MSEERQPDNISREILLEYMRVDMAGEVDMDDMLAVRHYAMHHDLIRLAGWLSWNGERFYDVLVNKFADEYQPSWVDEAILSAPLDWREGEKKKKQKLQNTPPEAYGHPEPGKADYRSNMVKRIKGYGE